MTRSHHVFLRWICVVFFFSPTLMAQETSWQQLQDLELIHRAGLSRNPKSFIEYIQKHALSTKDRERLEVHLNKLGHRSWAQREQASEFFVSTGRPALAFLNDASHSADKEIARRAERAREAILAQPHAETMQAVIRLLVSMNTHEAIPALFDYLPWATEDTEVRLLFDALVKLGLKNKQPRNSILEKRTAPQVRVRAAVAYVLGKSKPLPHRPLKQLLYDLQPEVRFHAAEALIKGGDKHAVPVMIALLREMPTPMCCKVEDILYQLDNSEDTPDSLQNYSQRERERAAKAWSNWWQTHEAKIDIASVNFENPVRGYTLVCEYDGGPDAGCVWLAGRDGKPRWEIHGLDGPNDAHLLSHNRILVAERNASRVTERDLKGNILWQKKVDGGAIACQRMHDGNVLIASWVSVIAVDRNGRKLWTFHHSRGMRYTCQLKDRRILGIAANGDIFFLNDKGKLLQTITPEAHGRGAGYWASVELLTNDNLLVALGSAGKVVEINQKGKIVWQANVPNAVSATRLRNGNTLVCNFEQKVVIELDPTGKQVKSQLLRGRPFVVRRY